RTEHSIHLLESDRLKDMVRADEWTVEVVPDHLGKTDVIRISVISKYGADFVVIQEVIAFFVVSGTPATMMWSGTGDRHLVLLDSCFIDENVTFRVRKDGVLERITKSRKTFRNADLAEPVAQDLRARCIAPASKRETFPLERH